MPININIFIPNGTVEEPLDIMTHNDGRINVDRTSLVGYIDITFDELTAALGPDNGGGDKTQAEWQLIEDSTVVATIYDYKERICKHDVTDWHIGGHDEQAVRLIRKVFPNHKIRGDGF